MHIVLVEPEIAPNTGSIARLCAATQTPLHLVEPLGFRIDDKHLRRAGLDYWPYVEVHRYPNWSTFAELNASDRLFFLAARSERSYTTCQYREDDFFVFGGESRGLPQELRESYADRFYGIPMASTHVRSLNLATTAAIVLYEALRQLKHV